MKRFAFILPWVFLSCAVAWAQFIPPGFPPGTFNSRAALDAAPATGCSGGTQALVDVVGVSPASGALVTSFTWDNSNGSPNVGSGPNGTTNRALVAAIIFLNFATGHTSGVSLTWNGVTMTPINNSGGIAGDMFFFGLTAPATGQNAFVANWTTTDGVIIAALSAVGVNQTGGSTTFCNFVTNTGTTVASPATASVTTTGPASGMSFAAYINNIGAFNPSSGTNVVDIGKNNSAFNFQGAANYATVGATTLNYGIDSGTGTWNAAGVSLKAN